MLSAISSSQHVIQVAANSLLGGSEVDSPNSEELYYNLDDVIRNYDSLPERNIIMIGEGATQKKVVLFNSLTIHRNEVVKFLVSTPFVHVSIITRSK